MLLGLVACKSTQGVEFFKIKGMRNTEFSTGLYRGNPSRDSIVNLAKQQMRFLT